MISVVGGTYHEVCKDTGWDHLYGSGLRAAAALTGIGSAAEFTTYVSGEYRPVLEAYSATFNINLTTNRSSVTPRFTYIHPLAEPWISPPIHVLPKLDPLEVAAEDLLVFGMLEASVRVKGRRVVYDPQDAFSPSPFFSTQSEADHLAVLVNRSEARHLCDLLNVKKLDDLRERLGAEVLVVKQGSEGGDVYTPEGPVHFPCYRTERVFPIGSGDIFAAGFSHHWITEGQDPESAAVEASKLAALWCNTPILPLRPSQAKEFPKCRARTSKEPQLTAYLAAPFFNSAERWLVEEARLALLRQGLKVFSPYHDVGAGDALEVAPKDLKGLIDSNVVFAVVDCLDPGTLFEIGYARARNIPVVVFTQKEDEESLKMLRGSGCRIVRDFSSAVYHACWMAAGD